MIVKFIKIKKCSTVGVKRLTLVLLPFVLALLSVSELRAQTFVNAPMTGTPAAGSYYNNIGITLSPGFSFTASAGQSLQLYTLSAGCSPLVTTPSASQNYIMTSVPRVSGITNTTGLTGRSSCELMQTVQYTDGLDRLIQTVQVKGSPAGNDVVQPVAYDIYGREAVKYLPYALTTGVSDGSYKANALTAGAGQAQFYSSPPAGMSAVANPYAQTGYEISPLNRPIEQGAPGAPWQLSTSGVSGSGHTIKTTYLINNSIAWATDSLNSMQVARYDANINSDQSRTLVANGYYAAGQLTVTVSKDENWVSGRAGTTEEYKDKEGHVVLKRQYNYTTVLQALSTYYVYDDMGDLAFVLPPAANGDADASISQTTLDNLCYQYRYDDRGRVSQKKVPGKGWEYMVYNYIDKVVATQDAIQRAKATQEWTITKYDGLGRTVLTGIYQYPGSTPNTNYQAALQGTLTGITNNLWETPVSTGNGYNNASWPTTSVTATLGINFYDSYTNIPGLPAAYSSTTGVSNMTRSLPTVKKTAVLNNPTDMLWEAMYYDDLGRNIKTYIQHYLGGTANTNNYDVINTTYNFTNAPTTTSRQHFTVASTTVPLVTVANTYIYDQAGRKLKTWEQITNGNSSPTAKTLISQIDYNEIGQVLTKHLHSADSLNFSQNVAYTYNERGWLSTCVAPLFQMQLQYNTGTNKQYNGNIAYQLWGTGTAPNTNTYTYTYDKLNRLTGGISADNYKETGITYDLMGNITALTRYQANSPIDQLTYTYNSTNQVQSINDANATPNAGLAPGTTTYTYDGNGNMLSGTNTANTRQNKSFTYNLLNLPLVVTVPTGTITYTYDASGQKLRKVSVLSGVTKTTDYIAGIEYDNSTTTIGFIQTEEGKAVPTSGGGYDYTYYLGDNLGNTRVTFDTKTGSAVMQQQDDYYPFSLEISRGTVTSPKNEYLYNKKELQEEFAEYDYGARFYDPVIARWQVVDAYADHPDQINLSPYAYVGNNPIGRTDPDGNCWTCVLAVAWESAGTVELGSFGLGTPAAIGIAVVGTVAAVGTLIYEHNQQTKYHVESSSQSTSQNESKKVHGNSKTSDKPTEHYQLKDQNGKTYDGVGDANGNRSDQSKKKLEKENPGNTFEKSHSKVHPNRAEALKAEHEGIQKSGGPQGNDPNGTNYNKINSPGAKIK